MRREALGISQVRLGRHLGLTFSQIQKYERGWNRIGAGRLYQIASFLGVTVSHFFEGLERPAETPNGEMGPPRDIESLTEAFASITDSEIRASVLALMRYLPKLQNPSRHRGLTGFRAVEPLGASWG